ncbi:MAG: hypothetical protein ACRCUT_04465 [Spirochaetota bacterium]
MKKLLAAASVIGSQYRKIFIVLLSASAFIIAGDIFFRWSSLISPESVVKMGGSFGGIAAAFAVAALSYYLLRSGYIALKKSTLIVPPAADFFLKDCVALMRDLHTVCGAAAITSLLLHFYIIFIVAYGYQLNGMILTGFAAAAVFLVLASLGMILYRDRQNIRVRRSHRIIAFLAFAAFIIHRIIIIAAA